MNEISSGSPPPAFPRPAGVQGRTSRSCGDWPQKCRGSSISLQPGLSLRLPFFSSLHSLHLAFLIASASCHLRSLRDIPNISNDFCSFFFFYFKLQGRRIKAQVVSTSASVFVTLFQPPLPCPPVFLLGRLVPLSGVTAEKADRKERGHGNGEQRQETKEGRVQALK